MATTDTPDLSSESPKERTLQKQLAEVPLGEISEDNFGVGKSYPQIELLSTSKDSNTAFILVNGEKVNVSWNMGKNEPNFKSPENSDLKFIVVVADYKEDGKISLLLSNGRVVSDILEEDPFYVRGGKIYFNESIETKSGKSFHVLKEISGDKGSDVKKYLATPSYIFEELDFDDIYDYGEGHILTRQGIYSTNLPIRKYESLNFKGKQITQIKHGNHHYEFKGNYDGKDIEFYFNPNLTPKIPSFQINETMFLLDNKDRIISPLLFNNYKIDRTSEESNINGFDGSLFKISNIYNKDIVAYTDGKRIIELENGELTLSLGNGQNKEYAKTDEFHRYEKEGSRFDGYAIAKKPESYTTGYYTGITGVYGQDYVILESNEGKIYLLFKDGKEIEVKIDERKEVSTPHSQNLGKGKIIGFHPEKSIIVLGSDGKGASSSDYRYYSIKSDGSLTYIGSKINLSNKGNFIDSEDNNNNYSIINDKSGFPITYMVGNLTFIATVEESKEDKYRLIILSYGTINDYYRTLGIKNYIDIPTEYITKNEQGNLEGDMDKIKNLVQFIPGSDVIYIAWKSIKLESNEERENGHMTTLFFCDAEGKLVNPDKVDKLATIKVGENDFYILTSNEQFGSKSKYYLYNPTISEKAIAIESLDEYTSNKLEENNTVPNEQADGNLNTIFILAKKLTKTSDGAYIYPPMEGDGWHDSIRLAIIPGQNGIPVNSFVIYDKEKNTIRSLNSSEYPIQTATKDVYIIERSTGFVEVNIETGSEIIYLNYKGVKQYIKSSKNRPYIGYYKEDLYIKVNENGEPVTVDIEGSEYYLSNEVSTHGGKEIANLLNSKNGKVLPFYNIGGNYTPVFGGLELSNMFVSLESTDRGLVIASATESSEKSCNFKLIGRESIQAPNSIILLSTLISNGTISLIPGISINDFLNHDYPKTSIYFVYEESGETIAIKLDKIKYINADEIEYNGTTINIKENEDLLLRYLSDLWKVLSPKSEETTVVSKKVGEQVEGGKTRVAEIVPK